MMLMDLYKVLPDFVDVSVSLDVDGNYYTFEGKPDYIPVEWMERTIKQVYPDSNEGILYIKIK